MAIAERAKSAALMESGAATSDTSRLPCNRVCKTAYSHELLRPEPGGGGTRDAWKVVNQPIAIIVRHWYGAVDWSIDRLPAVSRVSPLDPASAELVSTETGPHGAVLDRQRHV